MMESFSINLLSRIAVTTGTIMPIHCILLVKIDSRGEVCDGFVVLEEAVPDQPTTVIRWSILGVELDDSIEIFQSLFEAITANFLSYSAQVMDRLHIIRLQLDGLEVVFLSLRQVIGLIPAECSVVVRFEMIRVEFDSSAIIRNGSIEIALLAVCEASIMIEISLSRFYLDSGREALNGLIEVPAPIQ